MAGAGIAQVPDALAFSAIQDGKLRAVLTDLVAMAPPIMLVYPGNRYLTAKVRAFGEFFVEVFPANGWWPIIAEAKVTAA